MSKKPKVVALIQARTGSNRLPSKILKRILDRPMLEHQIERVKLATMIDEIVVATSLQPHDQAVVSLASDLGVGSFAGDEEDVLDRLFRAASQAESDIVVRLTADCPLIDHTVIDQCIRFYLDNATSLDYVSTGPSFPDGTDVEVMSFGALRKAWQEATKKYEREHVTVFIWQSGRFRIHRLTHTPDLGSMRWTVDEESDLRFVTEVYERLFPTVGYKFGMKEILELLSQNPALIGINQGIIKNEGFLRSLRKERVALVAHRQGSIHKSEEWWNRAKHLIPAGTQTLSKGPTQYVNGVAPKYLARGQGSHVWDVDGNEYIDYPMALGAVLLGYNYEAVTNAIQRQLQDGITFSVMHPLEVEVAELLRDMISCAEMVRFGKNGSDVTTGAVRLARAYTGRDKIVHCGYHGWHDWYIGSTTRDRGVPSSVKSLQLSFAFNDFEVLNSIFREHGREIAAVIMEPYGATLPKPGFLASVRQVAHENGSILIFDEVASGFRFCPGGVYQYLSEVEPDLACFGKAMANGMPISALVGKAEIMRLMDEVFFSFTFGGECLSLAAAKATLMELRTKPVIPHLWEVGTRLQEGFNRLASDYGLHKFVECLGLAPRTYPVFSDIDDCPALIVKSLFQQEVVKRGVLAISAGHCMSFSHTVDDIEYTLGVYQEAFEIVAKAVRRGQVLQQLEGIPIQPVFRPVN